jgi:hypothetical protein
MTGAAERLSTGRARRLTGGFGQVQAFVADQALTLKSRPRFAERRLGRPHQGMPVDPDQPLALAPLDEHVQPLDRHIWRNETRSVDEQTAWSTIGQETSASLR